jgi:CBS domain-containing protein
MASPLLTITPDRPMLDASHLMEINQVRHLCVSEGGAIVGLISVRDLVKHFVEAESGPIRELDDVYRPLSVLMRTSIETIDGKETLLTAARRMAEKRTGSLLVAEAGGVVGIVTESDMVRKALAYNLEAGLIPVGSLMNHPVIETDINRTVHDASDLMAEKGIRHLAVTENHKIVGILSVRDLIRMISVRDRPRFLRER